jgi:hypothetical protein
MYNRINYNLLTAKDLGDLVRQVLVAIDISTLPDGTLKTMLLKLTDTFGQYEKGYEFNPNDPFTVLLDAKDSLRDTRFRSMRLYIQSFEGSDNTAEDEAAQALLKVIERHGWSIDRLRYAEESVALTGLTNELTGKWMAQLTTLNAANHVAKVKAAQSEFEAVQKQRVDNNLVETPTMTAYRKPLIDLMKRVIQTLDNDIVATQSEALKAFYTKIDSLIGDTMAFIKTRETLRDKQKSETVVAPA